MAVIQGTKTSEDIKNMTLYLANGTLYSTTERIYFEDDKSINLGSGKYLISITGNVKFASEDGYLGTVMYLNRNRFYEDLEPIYASYKNPYLTVTQLVNCRDDGNRFEINLINVGVDQVNYTITIMKIGEYELFVS